MVSKINVTNQPLIYKQSSKDRRERRGEMCSNSQSESCKLAEHSKEWRRNERVAEPKPQVKDSVG